MTSPVTGSPAAMERVHSVHHILPSAVSDEHPQHCLTLPRRPLLRLHAVSQQPAPAIVSGRRPRGMKHPIAYPADYLKAKRRKRDQAFPDPAEDFQRKDRTKRHSVSDAASPTRLPPALSQARLHIRELQAHPPVPPIGDFPVRYDSDTLHIIHIYITRYTIVASSFYSSRSIEPTLQVTRLGDVERVNVVLGLLYGVHNDKEFAILGINSFVVFRENFVL